MPGTPSHKIAYPRNKPSYSRVSNESKKFEDYDEYEVNRIDGKYKSIIFIVIIAKQLRKIK